MSEKKEILIFATALPLIVVLILVVWGVEPHTGETITATSTDGMWGLFEIGFAQKVVRLTGAVEYMSDALLTSEVFSERTDIRLGQPGSET